MVKKSYTLSEIDSISFAKIMASLYFFIGILAGVLYALIALISFTPTMGFSAALALSIIAFILMPFIYAIIGFLFGLLLGFLYNIIASYMGGIRMYLK